MKSWLVRFAIAAFVILWLIVISRIIVASREGLIPADAKMHNAALQAVIILGSAIAAYISKHTIQQIIALTSIIFAISIIIVDWMFQKNQSSSELNLVWWILVACQDIQVILYFIVPRWIPAYR
jgi:hypothetical protein